jgi:hypothetical protein
MLDSPPSRDLVDRGVASVVEDLAGPTATRGVAEQANRLGQMDAVISSADAAPARPSCP